MTTEHRETWTNVQQDCPLCQMEKRTDWYLDTSDWLVADTLGGSPFVVKKEHTKTLTDEQWAAMERVVDRVFDEYELVVLMNLVEDHWHAHIRPAPGTTPAVEPW